MPQQNMYRAKVTRVNVSGVFCEVPALGVGAEFGPLERPNGMAFAVGDRVLLGQVENVVEDLVIISSLGAGAATFGGVDGGTP